MHFFSVIFRIFLIGKGGLLRYRPALDYSDRVLALFEAYRDVEGRLRFHANSSPVNDVEVPGRFPKAALSPGKRPAKSCYARPIAQIMKTNETVAAKAAIARLVSTVNP